jgi:threonyl-tRNA synthetase
MVIIGKNEEKTGTITIRKKIGGDIREIKLEDFTEELKNTIRYKKKIY